MEYRLYFKENNVQKSFGIEVFEHGKQVRCIPDVSCDKDSLKKLVDSLNELGAGISELDFIIEDYLTFFDI